MLEADLSSGKGQLWLKSPKPAKDGTLFVARYMGQGKAAFELGADLFVHIVYGPSGDRCLAIPPSSRFRSYFPSPSAMRGNMSKQTTAPPLLRFYFHC